MEEACVWREEIQVVCLLFTAMPSIYKITSSSQITVDGDCAMKLKDAFSLEKKLWQI